MFKKVMAVIGAVVVVATLGLYAVGAVSAENPTPTPQAQPPKAGPWGYIGRGLGVVGDAVAKLLGMTQEQIRSERANGKTLGQIAKEKGVSDQQVIDAIVAAQKQVLDQAVKDGRITQAQADWLLARAKALAPFELTNPFAPGGRFGMHGGRGFRGGHGCRCWGGQNPTPTPSGTSQS